MCVHVNKRMPAPAARARAPERSCLWIHYSARDIRDRRKRLQDLNSKFGFLLDVQSLIASENVNEDSLPPHCVDFAIAYEGDVDASSLLPSSLLLEIMDCRMLEKA